MNGQIFNIQRFSIHDGPGIRTTVFMKGCNLRCRWCHNPESQVKSNQLMFFRDKCIGCGECIKICDKRLKKQCTDCGNCVSVCKSGALELCGSEISVEDLLSVILKDKKYYENSGGGVTFSGGEPLLQLEFLKEILKECRKENIHTAIETAANVDWNAFLQILPLVDLVICDIKCIDDEKHKWGTGVSNKLILENIKKLKKCRKELLFRTPLIPGYNHNEIEKIVDIIGEFKLELMPYHSLGESKYQALGREYSANACKVPERKLLTSLSKKFSNVFFSE